MRCTVEQASCRKVICASISGWAKLETVDLIEVKWPTTQKIERFTQVKANQIITIREGEGLVKPRN